jgi:regulator of protease activity HflC (stomatin/prohibitin superfamily)
MVKEGINEKSQALKVASLAGVPPALHMLTLGLPPETLRIASEMLAYLEDNSQPVIHPGDEFLSSFVKSDMSQPIMDEIRQSQLEEDTVEELKEVVDIEEDDQEAEEEATAPLLYTRVLSERERRKMEKVQAKAEKDAEKARQKAEFEALKAERDKDKVDRKMKAIVSKLKPMGVASSLD